MELTGKTCVVSGAAGGIGYAVCAKYAENGGNVVMLDINKDKLEIASEEIKAMGAKVLPLVINLASVSEIKKVIETAENTFGEINILASCAGVSGV